jgi:hypothetical protein
LDSSALFTTSARVRTRLLISAGSISSSGKRAASDCIEREEARRFLELSNIFSSFMSSSDECSRPTIEACCCVDLKVRKEAAGGDRRFQKVKLPKIPSCQWIPKEHHCQTIRLSLLVVSMFRQVDTGPHLTASEYPVWRSLNYLSEKRSSGKRWSRYWVDF